MREIFRYAKEDMKAYGLRKRDIPKAIFTVSNFCGIFLYRLSHWLYLKRRETLSQAVRGFVKIIWNMDISPAAVIGKGFRIVHSQGVVIGDNVVIGDYCCIFQNVTLGGNKKRIGLMTMPVLDNYVTVYAGACVLGPVWLSMGTEVGANAVLTKSVTEPLTVVAGIPAKKIGKVKIPQSLRSMEYREDYEELIQKWYKQYS